MKKYFFYKKNVKKSLTKRKSYKKKNKLFVHINKEMSELEIAMSLFDPSEKKGTDELQDVKTQLTKYIATPWDSSNRKLYTLDQYNKECKNCQGVCKNCAQAHAGDLYEHTQWTMGHIFMWFENNEPETQGLDLATCIVSGFFHDVGKGYDCLYDMYHPDKYNKKGDHTHPTYSCDLVLGKINFNRCDDSNTEINIRKVISDNFPHISVELVALASYMHWELGKINIRNEFSEEEKYTTYLQKFREGCNYCSITPSVYALRVCLLVAAADIASGSNKRLPKTIKGRPILKENYIGFDPWVVYGMDLNYKKYISDVIERFTNPRSLKFKARKAIKSPRKAVKSPRKAVKSPSRKTRKSPRKALKSPSRKTRKSPSSKARKH